MTDCPELEDLLKEGSGGHAAHCSKCRELLDALAQVDSALDAAFGNISAPPDLEIAVRAGISRVCSEGRPSILPEVLDLIGWAAVLAAAAIAVPYFASLLSAVITGIG
jgi:hypothetical protein